MITDLKKQRLTYSSRLSLLLITFLFKSLNTYEQVDIHFIETTVNELRNMIKKLEIEVRGV